MFFQYPFSSVSWVETDLKQFGTLGILVTIASKHVSERLFKLRGVPKNSQNLNVTCKPLAAQLWLLGVAIRILCEPVCQVALSYVHVFVFMFIVALVLFSTDLLKWLMWRNNKFASNCFKLGTTWHTHKKFKETCSDIAQGLSQTYEWFKHC